jgi:hypothetical protein
MVLVRLREGFGLFRKKFPAAFVMAMVEKFTKRKRKQCKAA